MLEIKPKRHVRTNFQKNRPTDQDGDDDEDDWPKDPAFKARERKVSEQPRHAEPEPVHVPVAVEKKPEPPPEPVVHEASPVVTYPPLPRYISHFRDFKWFQTRFPRALPETFNFLREPATAGVAPQISLKAWVDFMASSAELDASTAAKTESANKVEPARRISLSATMRAGTIYQSSVDDAIGMLKGFQDIARNFEPSAAERDTMMRTILSLMREQVARLPTAARTHGRGRCTWVARTISGDSSSLRPSKRWSCWAPSRTMPSWS